MINKLKIGFWAVIVIAVVASSCKKDNEEDFLVDAGCWRLVKSESKENFTGGGTWMVDTLKACEADDCLQFKSDGGSSLDEGATKCFSTDPQTSNVGTWKLSEDFKTLTVIDGQDTIPFTVTELTKSRLVLSLNLVIAESRQTFEAK